MLLAPRPSGRRALLFGVPQSPRFCRKYRPGDFGSPAVLRLPPTVAQSATVAIICEQAFSGGRKHASDTRNWNQTLLPGALRVASAAQGDNPSGSAFLADKERRQYGKSGPEQQHR